MTLRQSGHDGNDCFVAPTEQPSLTRPFRFKTKQEADDRDESSSQTKRHRHPSSRQHVKRRRTSGHLDDPGAYDDSAHGLSSESAFRESLFDALGDDEGAAFWEGVYGQAIHKYPNTYQDAETGELERMNDDEYAQFVRRKMWEKSWEGIEAAKEEQRKEAAREKARIRANEQKDARRENPTTDPVFDTEIEHSLKRGEQRKSRRRWQALWRDYLQRWADLQDLASSHKKNSTDEKQICLRNKIAWPVESGKRKDLSPEQIEHFFVHGTKYMDDDQEDDTALMNVLKAERVKWHPDKIQHRFGFLEIDESTIKGVTAVFQVLDRMWNEKRVQK